MTHHVSEQKFIPINTHTIMQNLFTIFTILLSSTFLFSQNESARDADYYHMKNTHSINLGIGFPSTTNVAAEFLNGVNQDSKSTPQFMLRYEYAVNDKIGIGVYGGYYFGETEELPFENILNGGPIPSPEDLLCCLLDPDAECCEDNSTVETGVAKYQLDVFTIGGQATLHFLKFPKLDTYGIVRLGYNFASFREQGDINTSFLGFDVPIFEYFGGVGGRYFINKNLGIYGELGNSILSPVHINVGGTWRIN